MEFSETKTSNRNFMLSGTESVSRILVVDDEPEIVEETCDLLNDAEFSCHGLTDARQSVARVLSDGDITVLVTDLKMPGMNGLEMVKAINDGLPADREVGVIVITGHAGTEEAIEAVRLGAMDFLSKPISPDQLVQAVKRAEETILLRRLKVAFNQRLEHQVAERTEEVHALNRRLVKSNRVKGEFLSLISHELRTPLNTIIGFSQLMAAQNGNGEKTGGMNYNEKVADAGKKLLSVVNTILDLVEAKSGELSLHREKVDLVELLKGVVQMQRHEIDAKSLDLLVETPGGPVQLDCDRERIAQAIHHLLANAVAFTPNGGQVGVAVEQGDKETSVTIVDSGEGMTGDEIEIALQPFRQVDGSSAKSHYGMGLGLTLARLFAEMHDGTLEIKSVPQVGTTVTIKLPAGAPAND